MTLELAEVIDGEPSLKFVEELRDSGNSMPVIAVTALSDDETTWSAWQAGVTVFLPKPVEDAHLLHWVRTPLDLDSELRTD